MSAQAPGCWTPFTICMITFLECIRGSRARSYSLSYQKSYWFLQMPLAAKPQAANRNDDNILYMWRSISLPMGRLPIC
jgi:hypothetical protein